MVLSPVVGIMSNNLLSFNSASQVLSPFPFSPAPHTNLVFLLLP